MISYIEVKIKLRGAKFLIVLANGIGYKVYVLPDELKKHGDNASLWTHLRVREDALDLYGFESYSELEFFETLIQVSGIGPKSAMGVLSIAPLDTVKKAISSGEVAYLTKVSGIGKKMAERIIVELKDKMGTLSEFGSEMFKDEQDVVEALKSLGYSPAETREAVKQLPENIVGINNRIKEALKILGK